MSHRFLQFVRPVGADQSSFYKACRYGLLAYCCFPNSEWATAEDLLDSSFLPAATVAELFEAFVRQHEETDGEDDDDDGEAAEPHPVLPPAPPLPEPRAQWNSCPTFLAEQWRHAKEQERRRAQRAKRAAAKAAAQPAPGPAHLFEEDVEADEARAHAAARAARAEGEEEAPSEQLFHRWLHAAFLARGVRQPELRQAILAAGVLLPTDKTSAGYMKALQAALVDAPHAQSRLGKEQLCNVLRHLKLPRDGKKAQCAERLLNHLRVEDPRAAKRSRRAVDPEPGDLPDFDPSGGQGSDTETEPPARRNLAADLAQAAQPLKRRRLEATGTGVSDFAAELSSDFLNKFEDALDHSGDAGEEQDVKAEEEALLPHAELVNPKALHPQLLAPAGLPIITAERAQQVIDAGARPEARPEAKPLDPTQKACLDSMLSWAHAAQAARHARRPLPRLRTLLLGTAGAGKSETLRLAVFMAREILGHAAVTVCAHTGVASSNTRCDGETINSVFLLHQEGKLSEGQLKRLAETLGECCLLVVDEIGMVGSQQLARTSPRLVSNATPRSSP